jgi:hypothetical protein
MSEATPSIDYGSAEYWKVKYFHASAHAHRASWAAIIGWFLFLLSLLWRWLCC